MEKGKAAMSKDGWFREGERGGGRWGLVGKTIQNTFINIPVLKRLSFYYGKRKGKLFL